MKNSLEHSFKVISSPVGLLTLIIKGDALAAILWENENPNRVKIEPGTEHPHHPLLSEVHIQLNEYFLGKRKKFDLPLDFTGTEFQKRVWHALLTIPYGETRSYRQIARQIGHEQAVRAVGAANGRNPISIIAPCHRVVGSNGSLTGFAGGLMAKQQLLTMEMRD